MKPLEVGTGVLQLGCIDIPTNLVTKLAARMAAEHARCALDLDDYAKQTCSRGKFNAVEQSMR